MSLTKHLRLLFSACVPCVIADAVQAEEERGDMEKVKLDNKRILFNLLPAHVAQHFLMSNPRNMVSVRSRVQTRPTVPDMPRRSWLGSLRGQVQRLGLNVK